MVELTSVGLCLPKLWSTTLRNGNITYYFGHDDIIAFETHNTVIYLTCEDRDINNVRISIPEFIEKFDIIPYKFCQFRDGRSDRYFKFFKFNEMYYVQSPIYDADFDILSFETFRSLYKFANVYRLCKSKYQLKVKLTNDHSKEYKIGEKLLFIVTYDNQIRVGGKDEISVWSFHEFMHNFEIVMDEDFVRNYQTFVKEFDPFGNLFENGENGMFSKEFIDGMIYATLEGKDIKGTDSDGGIVGEKGDDGMEVLKHQQEIEEGIFEIKTNMLR